jgi:hypothetical protein
MIELCLQAGIRTTGATYRSASHSKVRSIFVYLMIIPVSRAEILNQGGILGVRRGGGIGTPAD